MPLTSGENSAADAQRAVQTARTTWSVHTRERRDAANRPSKYPQIKGQRDLSRKLREWKYALDLALRSTPCQYEKIFEVADEIEDARAMTGVKDPSVSIKKIEGQWVAGDRSKSDAEHIINNARAQLGIVERLIVGKF